MCKILVIDDEKVIINLLQEVLEMNAALALILVACLTAQRPESPTA